MGESAIQRRLPLEVLKRLLQPKFLNALLILLILASLSYLVTLLVNQQTLIKKDVLELTGLKKYLTPQADSKKKETPSLVHHKEDYQKLATTSFFREPNFINEQKPKQPVSSIASLDLTPYRSLKVMGLVGGNQAIIQDPATKTMIYVKEGDSIKEGTVTEVRPNKVTIHIGEETVELTF